VNGREGEVADEGRGFFFFLFLVGLEEPCLWRLIIDCT